MLKPSRIALTAIVCASLVTAPAAAAATAPTGRAAPGPHGAASSQTTPALGAPRARRFPNLIALPTAWQAEGIATGDGTSVYAGSLATGAIWKGDLRTGRGSVLVPGREGRIVAGLKVSGGLIYAAGATTGQAYVYDAHRGAEVAVRQLAPRGASFINDVTLTRDAAYFTDSQAAVLYRVGVPRRGQHRHSARHFAVTAIPLTGDWQQIPGFNANGIAASPDGRTLFVVHSTLGFLYRVDARTGRATKIAEGLTGGDGILLRGRALYVVRNSLNQVAVLRMARDYSRATLVATLTDPDFSIPTTVAAFGPWLYVVNAKFGTPPQGTPYEIVKVNGKDD